MTSETNPIATPAAQPAAPSPGAPAAGAQGSATATATIPVLMTPENMLKVCSFVSLTYLALILYFLGQSHGWGFFTELPIKATRDLRGHVASLFGIPVCALAFVALAWLMRKWNQRRAPSDDCRWNRFPVPFHVEIPSSDPIGRAYRAVFFLLIFGVGAYTQADLFHSFLTGEVHLDWPAKIVPEPAERPGHDEDCRSFKPNQTQLDTDPRVAEFANSKCGVVIGAPIQHFQHRFTGLGSNEYHFAQMDGLTYFPGFQPYAYLILTLLMFVVWGWTLLAWIRNQPVTPGVPTPSAT